MKIKIKTTPDDFKVKETARLPLQKKGRFAVYILEKRGWNTIDALYEISRALTVPFTKFSYGGKKDRHAYTSQFIAVEGERLKDIIHKDLTLTFQGFMDRPMGPDLIEGNQFQTTIRKLSPEEAKAAVEECDLVRMFGFPNYFDDQRFGSYDRDQGFLAEKILVGHFNGAAKIAMTSRYSENTKEDLERKQFFNEHWKDWSACASHAATDFERDAFEALKKGEKGCLEVLNAIPREELSMCFSAYQSFLWNEVARAVIKKKADGPLVTVEGDAGDYLFYLTLSNGVLHYFERLSIPTAAHNTAMPDDITADIYEQLLESRGVKKPMFNKMKIRRAFFKANSRPLIVRPEGLTAQALTDELNSGKSKAVLTFTLPRGSYATMLLKRLFATAKNS
jgi:tRNA pseudouridine13 synthase